MKKKESRKALLFNLKERRGKGKFLSF